LAANEDGRHLVRRGARGGKNPHELNVFVADWVE
jgi:hypothetical protein